MTDHPADHRHNADERASSDTGRSTDHRPRHVVIVPRGPTSPTRPGRRVTRPARTRAGSYLIAEARLRKTTRFARWPSWPAPGRLPPPPVTAPVATGMRNPRRAARVRRIFPRSGFGVVTPASTSPDTLDASTSSRARLPQAECFGAGPPIRHEPTVGTRCAISASWCSRSWRGGTSMARSQARPAAPAGERRRRSTPDPSARRARRMLRAATTPTTYGTPNQPLRLP